ncbi:MAG: hypothetical protein KC657_09785 [Myxococcales bacterium]|nr:hypothetical protein [Myxococcales bacterium]
MTPYGHAPQHAPHAGAAPRAAPADGTPVLCKRCGAPTDVQPDLSLVCRFCGTPDRLPPDELGRALEIRGRLLMAASSVSQVASTEAALAGIFERRGAFWTVMGPWPVLALLVVGYSVLGALSTLSALPDAVPDDVRVELIVASLYAPFFILGITLSFPVALLVGRFSYRRSVRPHLAARPPHYPGAPMRCRACGGDLPATRDAITACRFCRTANALAADLARDAQRQLDAEIAAYRARASGAVSATSRAATHMTRTVIVCFALVYVGIFALGALTKVVLTAL